MGDHEFRTQLNALADQASLTMALRPSADIRRRGNIRLLMHHAATSSLGVVIAGILAIVAVPILSGRVGSMPADPGTSAPLSSLTPLTVTGQPMLGVVLAEATDGRALTELPNGSVGLAADSAKRLTLDADRVTGRTWTFRVSGTDRCLAQSQASPTEPVRLRTELCTPKAKAQQFVIDDAAQYESPGYYLSDTAGSVVYDGEDGLIVQELPDGGGNTWQFLH
jgi:hypothetical protein